MPDSFEMDCWIINSLNSYTEHAASVVSTLYTGAQITKTIEFLFDVETAGEKGISQVLGLAGFTNLDVVRNPSLGAEPYIARAMLHQIVLRVYGRLGWNEGHNESLRTLTSTTLWRLAEILEGTVGAECLIKSADSSLLTNAMISRGLLIRRLSTEKDLSTIYALNLSN